MRKAELAAQIVYVGIEAAHLAGHRCTHLVVTDAHGLMLHELMRRWKLLRQRLQRQGFMAGEYVTVLGWEPSTGRLHLHVVVAPANYAPHALLARHAREVGLGRPRVMQITDSEDDRERIANYLGRNLLAFENAPKADSARLRPFNASLGWPGGSMSRPAWRDQLEDRSFIIVGFTANGVLWHRPLKEAAVADRLLDSDG